MIECSTYNKGVIASFKPNMLDVHVYTVSLKMIALTSVAEQFCFGDEMEEKDQCLKRGQEIAWDEGR